MAVSLDAVVMAGGRSRRMGTDKAGLPHPTAGEPLLLRQLGLIVCLRPATVFVSARTGQSLPPLPPDIRRVLDDGTAGPLGGIVAGLTASHATHLLVLAVDLPDMDAATLRHLTAKLVIGRGRMAQSPHGLEPLVALYPREILPRLRSLIAQRRLGLQTFLQETTDEWFDLVAFASDAAFRNWNRPDSP